jgi:hypothetical protein
VGSEENNRMVFGRRVRLGAASARRTAAAKGLPTEQVCEKAAWLWALLSSTQSTA